jgi:copper chaperone CopZ
MTQQTFSVAGMRCARCADTVKQTLLKMDGVSAVEVALQTGAPSPVHVQADRVLDPDHVQAALAANGDFRIQA